MKNKIIVYISPRQPCRERYHLVHFKNMNKNGTITLGYDDL